MPGALLAGASAHAQGAATSGLPRNQTLIVENPEGTIRNAGWFNIWAVNAGGQSTGLHQLALDTFWYIDPDHGIEGVWDNSLAAEPPIYNADFTEMTVKLRQGIFWSDGKEFTADDVVFTTDTHLKTNGLVRSAQFQLNVASIEAPDPHTVVFKLKKPNSRFHSLFTVRWNAAWIMPKHIFEGKDPLKFDFNPPVSIGAYKLHGYDPNGQWFTWEKRDDWQRTTLARFGEPGPRYVTYVDPGPPDRRVIAQKNHELDVIHDVSPEGMLTLAKDSPSSIGWFEGFPYAHPDPTLPQVILNHQNPKFESRDVRWALALAIDIKAVAMASYRGAATISAIAIPPTGTHPEYYHNPMKEWLTAFEVDTGQRKIRPYDASIGEQIAALLRPSMGDQIPDDPAEISACVRGRLVEAGHRGGSRADAAGRLHPARQQLVHAQRRAVRDQAHGRGRRPPGDDAGRDDDRPAVAPVRHRRHGGGSAGGLPHPAQRRRLRGRHQLERGDLGRAPRPVVLPRQLALAVRPAGRQGADPAQLVALVEPRARQDHRGDPQDLASTIPRVSSSAGSS